jgi:ribonucleoside-triphosphate reductase
VAVSFLFRNDPTKTAKDLGYPYLPQEVVTREVWEAYEKELLPVDIDASFEEIGMDDCATGACPIR